MDSKVTAPRAPCPKCGDKRGQLPSDGAAYCPEPGHGWFLPVKVKP